MSVLPEENDGADGAVLTVEKRKGSHLDGARDPVEACESERGVRLSSFQQRDTAGHLLERHRRTIEPRHAERLGPRLRGELSRLPERPSEDELRWLVVVDEAAVLVGDEHRRRELRRELPRENQHEVLLTPSLRLHELSLKHGRGASKAPLPSPLFPLSRP